MARFVYAIDDEAIAGLPDPRALLGGKGASLAALAELGIPVPPAFVITTEAFHRWRNSGDASFLDQEIDAALAALERAVGRRFGNGDAPLLVSVRSGAAVSMPGMMDTVLNVGACAQTLPELRTMLGADVADGVMRRLADDYSRIVGDPLPSDPRAQLRGGIAQVFRSWDSARAQTYRRRAGIDDDLGTAVTVQAMVFGVAPGFSGTGVMFTRNPADGARRAMGDWLQDAQGEDVVSGSHKTDSLDALAQLDPVIWDELLAVAASLERHQQDMCDIEFTIETGKLWVLQYRAGKRSPLAAARIAIDLVEDAGFALTREQAMHRVSEEQLAALFDQRDAAASGNLLGKGLAASAGIASGKAALSVDAALDMTAEGELVVLVRPETSPQDIPGMDVAEGILTATGGLVSHAAIVAREWQKPAVVGLAELHFDAEGATIGGVRIAEGDLITIDGTTGNVYAGILDTTASLVSSEAETFLNWAKQIGGVSDASPQEILRAAQAATATKETSDANAE